MSATGSLPSGTVTFMFTDIEDSTRLLQAMPDEYRALLGRHDALIREVLHRHDGVEVRSEGDAFFAAFTSAPAALAAAAEIQRGMASLAPLRVRIGLHTGEATASTTDYHGQLTVHAAARVADAANGDQVLVSDATRALVDGEFDDLGEHALKGIEGRTRLFRLSAPGMVADRRPPRTTPVLVRLPAALSTFVGRERERDEVGRALQAHRLVTLTGAGGSGKTRLAIECARGLAADANAVVFVDLSAVTAHASVGTAFTDAFELQPPSGTDPLEAVTEHLRSSDAVLVLDNCEQVLDGAGVAAARVLEACANVRIVATSREPLGVAGESILRVPSLSLPEEDSVDAIKTSEAGRLFLERARERDAGYVPSDADASAIAQICRRLDGIPLAIELAAARLGVLSPADIAKRLDDQFGLLASGSARIERQRTLRAAIDWSHRLLDDSERTMLRRLSVFGGPFSLEAAEHVADLPDALDLLGSLVDKSLVLAEPFEATRSFRLLETIRHYAAEKLADGEDPGPVRDRHLAWYVSFAERARDGIQGPDVARWLDHVEHELDNVRLALAYARDRDDGPSGARIVVGLERFWLMRAYLPDAHSYAAPLEEDPSVTGELHVRLLHTMCTIARWGSTDRAAIASYVRRALEEAEGLGDDALIAWSLLHDAFQSSGGREPERAANAERALEHARRTNDRHLLARCLVVAGFTWSFTDDEKARRYCREAEEIATGIGDIQTMNLARTYDARLIDEDDERIAALDRVIDSCEDIDDRWLQPWVTIWRASNLPDRDRIAELEHAIEMLQKVGQVQQALSARQSLAITHLGLGDLGRAEHWVTQVLERFRSDGTVGTLHGRAVAVLAAIRLASSRFDDAEQIIAAFSSRTDLPDDVRRAMTGVLIASSLLRGDWDRALALVDEMSSLNPIDRDDVFRSRAIALHGLGDDRAAREALARSLDEVGFWTDAFEVAETAAEVLSSDHPADAARLIGFARARRAELGTPLLPAEARHRVDAIAERIGMPDALADGARLTDADIVPLVRRLLDDLGVTVEGEGPNHSPE